MNEELKTFKITKQDLAKLLSVAFEKGWRGYLDLKEAIIDEIVDKFAEEHKVEQSPLPNTMSTVATVGMSGWTVPEAYAEAVRHMYTSPNHPVIDYGPNNSNPTISYIFSTNWFVADRGV